MTKPLILITNDDGIYAPGIRALIGLMRQVSADFPDTTLFSLPTIASEGQRRSLELGMKGPAARVAAAMACIKADLGTRGLAWEDKV